ncbi:partner of Y14 and mago-like [Macrosteles quadrilineatus]|uniref:partner of Y14 and mago-like n=1 Tax=Macrosteles quadrilineatus TaxID=74068 RepID=UPI0023E18BE7|nr:partner of Y14 and mago-like [Macrosteles quadrilineatus]XP_054288939.1 partner of Y14 and mago-like [Macrosteles quadrilineatus]
MAMARTVEVTDQGSFIPASQRPDGSWRKPRRVKEGYVPQEEVPLYESKGKQWANNQNRQYPVGLDPAIIKAREEAKAAAAKIKSPIPGLVIENDGKKKKKKKKTGENDTSEHVPEKSTNITTKSSDPSDEWKTVPSKSAKASKSEPVAQNAVPAAADPAKRLKNLKKKLREIETIEAKISAGEIKKPDKDQLEKVNRKSEVLSEIFALEMSLDD